MSEEVFRPYGFSKFTESFSQFRAACKAGMSIFYHAPDFVAMDRNSYNRLLAAAEKIEIVFDEFKEGAQGGD